MTMAGLGARIRRERIAQGMTQGQAAARARIGQSHFSTIESGIGNPTSRTLLAAVAAVADGALAAGWLAELINEIRRGQNGG
jgi:transcriptional regulator with XRE-family HTH domain